MEGRVISIDVNADWSEMSDVISDALERIGSVKVSTGLLDVISESTWYDALRCDRGYPHKPEDPIEVRLSKARESMERYALLREGKKAEGAVFSLVGRGNGWGLLVRCVERLTHSEVTIVALSSPEGYWAAMLCEQDPDMFGRRNDLRACQAKAEELAGLLSPRAQGSPACDGAASRTPAQAPSGGCYVATSVYGSYDCPQVWVLRRYRDLVLAKRAPGRAFVRAYYAVSPTLVAWFGDSNWFKRFWRARLDRMVGALMERGLKDTPYSDTPWR